MIWKENGNSTFEQCPTGTHIARCIRLIDIGTQAGEWKNQPTRARKNVLFWELPLELREDGKPFIISKIYTASLGENANLRKDLASWRGRDFTPEELRTTGFEPQKLLGLPCMITVIENDKNKSVVSSVSGVPKGMEVPPQINPSVFFDLENFQDSEYHALSDGMKKMIQKSEEWGSLNIQEEAAHTGERVAVANSAPAPSYAGVGGYGNHIQPPPADDDPLPF